jgi:hypothetical protein
MRKLRFVILSLSALLFSCASTPNKFGHHHDYPYKAPSHITATDEDECSRYADKEAFSPENTRGISEWPSIVFGPIGAIVQLTRMNHAVNSGYEKAMKACLRQKGYDLPE